MASPKITNILPLCSDAKVSIRDGYTGANARLFIPFYDQGSGYWFASGLIPTFPDSTVVQDKSRTLNGLNRPDTWSKDCCHPAFSV